MSYVDEARNRAKRRKSPWNLVMFALAIPAATLTSFGYDAVVSTVHRWRYPGDPSLGEARGWFIPLIVLGGALVVIPVAFFLANIAIHAIPSARRALDAEAKRVPGSDYESAQRQLLQFMAYLSGPGLLLGLCSSLVKWGR